MSVAQVLELELLQNAGVHVVAGETSLHREVTWVHAGEIEDIAEFLHGGELLLTAGTGIGAGAARQTAYVEALAQAGTSCLVLELGRRFEQVPEPMRMAAEAIGLPFAALASTVPFADVMRIVHGWIVGQRFALQARAERMLLDFNDLLLSGGSVAQILAKLSEVTGKPACLEDTSHHLVEYAGREAALEPLISDWDHHSRWAHRGGRGRPSDPVDESGHRCAWGPVELRGESWGRLHLVGVDTALDEFDFLAFDRAASAIGLALLNAESEQRLVERARGDLLDQAAHTSPKDENAFIRQARALGADFRGCSLIACQIVTPGAAVAAAITAATRLARTRQLPMLTADESEHARLLVGVPSELDPPAAARDLTAAVVQAWPGPAPITIGVSRPTVALRLAAASREAEECLRFARVSTATGVIEHSNLGLHLLLASQLDGPQLAAFVESELGRLLDHDARARSPLLPTLRALLRNDSNRAEAARELHLERRSVYYRIKRIEDILGYGLDDYDAKLALGVAIRALQLLEDRSVARGIARVVGG